MFVLPPLPPFEAPYYATVAYDEQITEKTEEQSSAPPLILYGRDVIYDTEQGVVTFKLNSPFKITNKIRKHDGENIILLKKKDRIEAPPKDCPIFDLKPKNVTIGYLGFISGYITLTTQNVTDNEAKPVLDKQCAKVDTQAVKTIINREQQAIQDYRVNP